MTNKKFAVTVAWVWLYAFVFCGLAASFAQDVRFAGAAVVFLVASMVSAFASAW